MGPAHNSSDGGPRLSLRTLGSGAPEVVPPAVDPRALSIGHVHLGLGAFHRAHQAVFTELAAAATGSTDWGIAAATGRSAAVRDLLAPQDGLYSVLERSPDRRALRIVGSLREVLDGGTQTGAVLDRIADPRVRVVTLTVTEKGYRRDAAGRLDERDELTAADVAGGQPRTAVGRLVRGLQRRADADAGPVTVLACDNLVGNGAVLAGLVRDFAGRLAPEPSRRLLDWVAASVRFPSTMVDRIVPATTAADRADVLVRLGLADRAPVVTEPFTQWVIEEDFATDRPAWDRVGAVLTSDVAPWEAAKLRILNASHSALAYLGGLRGYGTIAQALADPQLEAAVRGLMEQDVMPTLTAPDGLDLDAYAAAVRERFANPHLRHTTAQVAADGSQKLPMRLLQPIRERRAAGAMPHWALLALAGWMAHVAVAAASGRSLDDPLAAQLLAAAGAGDDPVAVVDGLLGIRAVFGDDLPADRSVRHELVSDVRDLLARH